MDLRLLRYFAAVVEERHIGRAADRLHMTQPPLSRAIKQLETELDVTLLVRTARGVVPTPAGRVLYRESTALFEREQDLRARVSDAQHADVLRIGVLADSAENAGDELAARFRRREPGTDVRVRESALSDPSCGLRTGDVDVAITRAPFDARGLELKLLRRDPIGAVLRADDPLAGRPELRLADLSDRRRFRFPDDTDEAWSSFWRAEPGGDRRRPVVRTIQECLHAVRWNDVVGLAPMGHEFPEHLVCRRIVDQPASCVVLAHRKGDQSTIVRSFVEVASALYEAGPLPQFAT